MKKPTFGILVCFLLVATLGCDSQSSELGKVQGKVTHDGQPVTEGTLTFYPSQEGRPGSGAINPDGTFVMTTFEEGDGLWIGPGKIEYTAPSVEPPEDLQPGQSLPRHKNYGMSPATPDITITEGTNTLDIELVRP